MANPEHLAKLMEGVEAWNQWRDRNFCTKVDLKGADLSGTDLSGANLDECDLEEVILNAANLSEARLFRAWLSKAAFNRADLSKAFLFAAHLDGAVLHNAVLTEADLREANLSGAFVLGANLSHADLTGADLRFANFRAADLSGADLSQTSLVMTNFERANLKGCRVYGSSAWDLKLEGAIQLNLVITPDGEPTITVDNLEVAQFIYLMLHNQKLRDVIDTVTGKGVLILGRFTGERKAVLDGIRDRLREHNLVPMVFDWEKPTARDLTETIQLLANMSRFVVADITDAKSIPQELMSIVPHMPSVPIRPIILSSQREYAMFEHFKPYPWMLPVFEYNDRDQLLDNIDEAIISPVMAWEASSSRKSDLGTQLQAEREENARLRAALQAGGQQA